MRDSRWVQGGVTTARDWPNLNALTCVLKSNFFFSLCLGFSSDSFAGYVTRGCSQPEEVDLTLKVLVSAAPVALIIIGLSILYSYPIDEERRQGNRKLLQEQRWVFSCSAHETFSEWVGFASLSRPVAGLRKVGSVQAIRPAFYRDSLPVQTCCHSSRLPIGARADSGHATALWRAAVGRAV